MKRYNCLGLQDWFVDSRTIVARSVSQAFEGRHYYDLIRLRKKIDTSIQIRVEDITNKFELMHLDLLNNLSKLMEERPFSKTLEHFTNMKECTELVTAVLSITGT